MSLSFLFPTWADRSDAAEQLLDQAASCRRLASVARTPHGAAALRSVATQFEADARRVAPITLRNDLGR